MRLREPAAWLLVAAAGTTVLVGVVRLVFGDSSPLGGAAEFGIRSVVALSELTSPVNAALVVGAVLLSTRFGGAPTPKSGLITMGGAGTLAVATLFGAISLLGSLFSGLGFGGKLETLLLGVPTFAITGLALVYVLTMVSPLPAGAAKPKKSRRLSVVPPAIPFPQTGDAHPVQNSPAEPDYSPYPQGPVFDQNGYAGQQVVEETPLPPVTPVVPVTPVAQQAERYSYPEPVYDDTPASWDSSPFSGFSGPQFARQAYEPPAAEAAPAPRLPVIETPFDSSVREVSGREAAAYDPPARESSVRDSVYDIPARDTGYDMSANETVYGAPVLEPSYEPPARESAYVTQPPVYGAPYEPGYEGDIREQQLAQAYQQAQSYQQHPDAYRQSNPFGYPQPAQPQRYQGDPLSDPLRAEDLLDPIDPVAIYRPAKTGEGLPADPASLDSDVTAHWYSPDRRER
ncbi:hypothetical protein FDA94_14090 [Herbidospora galbida]|uniref:Uncharacterized protein n=1 Tax=Herbidospora galbida TaxID=2575442 RepID=A0A4U3MK63_9ACTN|nr:hypothetical protein [Herbidospora galbida]TKK88417.1 hypothetical protein FDA94_14090 [Herbidospora galbida]